MNKVPDEHVYRGKRRPDSFYQFITSKYISKPLVPLLIKLGFRNPNSVTIISFLLLTASSILLLILPLSNAVNRIIIAVLIEVSFILDLSDGQLARVLKKTSLFGAWLDKYLDRAGEMVLYTAIGYVTWKLQGNFIYFIMGLSTGFLFTYYTIIYSLKDSIFFEEIKKNNFGLDSTTEIAPSAGSDEAVNKKTNNKSKNKILGKNFFTDKLFFKIVSIAFFYLNIGLGERYFYPIFFILINKTDIMLPIVLVLIFLRAGNVTLLLSRRIKKCK